MKTDLFQSWGHRWIFQICWHIECNTFTASTFGIWNISTEIQSPPLGFFVVMLSKAHLTSHSRMSGSRWAITPLWLSWSWRSFLYSSSVYSCHLFLISYASVRSKESEMQYLDAISKRQNDLCSFPRQTIQYHSNPSICPNQKHWRSWSWMVLFRPTRTFRTNTPQKCPFHYRGLECKSRKSRNTWSNRQIWPWSTEWGRAKANRVLPRERTGHSKHPLPTTHEKTLHIDITRWSI